MPLYARTMEVIISMLWMSRLLVGSSRINRSGVWLLIIRQQKANLIFSPPLSFPQLFSHVSCGKRKRFSKVLISCSWK